MKFEVGEVCEAQESPLVWIEVTLLSMTGRIGAISKTPVWSCIATMCGSSGLVAEACLRKKRPPADYIPLSVRDIFKIGETA